MKKNDNNIAFLKKTLKKSYEKVEKYLQKIKIYLEKTKK